MDIKKNILKRLIKTDDRISYVVSHHFIAYLWTIVMLVIGIIIVFLLYKLVSIFSFKYASWLSWVLWIFVYFHFLFNFLDVYLDAVVITDKALIVYQWYWILRHSIDVIDFDAVESVYSDQNWIIDTIFDRWDLIIRKASDTNIFESILSPWKVANKINNLTFFMTEWMWSKEVEIWYENVEKHWWNLDIFMKAMEEVVKEYKQKN